MPIKKPTVGGNQDIFPCSSAIFIAGIKSDQIDAAIITPDANPSKIFFINVLILFFNKKTNADPKVVPKNGISIPMIAICMLFIFL